MELHLAEAACRMGFEVVEDKEEPMEKTEMPRICQVLGVEVGEEWAYPEFLEPFRINQDGNREYKSKDGVWYLCQAEEYLTEIINHPGRIIRQPRFTQEEVAAAKILLGAGAVSVYKDEHGALRWKSGEHVDSLRNMLPIKLFPSLRPGQAVKLEDIVGDGL